MSTVYVVQQQRHRDPTGALVDRFDLTPAMDYGALHYVLGPKATPFRAKPTIEAMHRELKDFSTDDYLLLIGNPCLIGWAVAIAASKTNGRVRLLQWHGQSSSYLVVESEVFPCNDEQSSYPDSDG